MNAYTARVLDAVVYSGDDPVKAMAVFEVAADQAAVEAGAEMVTYMALPDGQVQAHAMLTEGMKRVGTLDGIAQKQWQTRERQP